jgi:hypothetical protein
VASTLTTTPLRQLSHSPTRQSSTQAQNLSKKLSHIQSASHYLQLQNVEYTSHYVFPFPSTFHYNVASSIFSLDGFSDDCKLKPCNITHLLKVFSYLNAYASFSSALTMSPHNSREVLIQNSQQFVK